MATLAIDDPVNRMLAPLAMAQHVTVTKTSGETVTGLYDGAFVIDATLELTGIQIATGALKVEWVPADEIASVAT